MAGELLTNEELVSLIRQGDDGYLPQLWDQVRRFIAKQAGAFMLRYTNAHGYANFDIDDLIDEAYFGMLKAVKRYDPEKGKFLTLLGLYIKTSFASVAGAQKRDAADYAKSLDAALAADESGKTSLYDLISLDDLDASITDESSINARVESVYTHELRMALERALRRLPKSEAHALRLNYFFGINYSNQAAQRGSSKQFPAMIGNQGLWHIRWNQKSMKELAEFLNPDEADMAKYAAFIFPESESHMDDEISNYLL